MKTLSDKINDYGYDDDGTPDCDILEVADVKKFIKDLTKNCCTCYLDNINRKKAILCRTCREIDKLAGDKLI